MKAKASLLYVFVAILVLLTACAAPGPAPTVGPEGTTVVFETATAATQTWEAQLSIPTPAPPLGLEGRVRALNPHGESLTVGTVFYLSAEKGKVYQYVFTYGGENGVLGIHSRGGLVSSDTELTSGQDIYDSQGQVAFQAGPLVYLPDGRVLLPIKATGRQVWIDLMVYSRPCFPGRYWYGDACQPVPPTPVNSIP